MDYSKMKKAQLVELATQQSEYIAKLTTKKVEVPVEPTKKYLAVAVVVAAAELFYIIASKV